MAKGIIPLEHAERFITSGKAIVVVYNEKTSGSRRYRIHERKEGLFYVYGDNPFIYLGHINHDREFKLLENDNLPESTKVLQEGFRVIWKWITNLNLPEHVKILHTGICGYCGRPLTDAQSILTGLGPVCAKKLSEKRIKSTTHETNGK